MTDENPEFVTRRVLRELAQYKIINETEDLPRLMQAVDVLVSPVVNIQQALQSHIPAALTISYYYHYLQRLLKNFERQKEAISSRVYAAMSAQFKRPTEKQLSTHLQSDAEYIVATNSIEVYEYYVGQLSDLRLACMTRARLLEQLSNNVRQEQRIETTEDR